MSLVFADTSHYIALANSHDDRHSKAVEFSRQFNGRILTTEFVLAELGSWLSRGRDREVFIEIWKSVEGDAETILVPSSSELLRKGMELFSMRPDKEWTLVDCISFEVMRAHGIKEALTADHHFEQAGFVPLLK
jgi:hypothetical protein